VAGDLPGAASIRPSADGAQWKAFAGGWKNPIDPDPDASRSPYAPRGLGVNHGAFGFRAARDDDDAVSLHIFDHLSPLLVFMISN
jgi:hypothetical protein